MTFIAREVIRTRTRTAGAIVLAELHIDQCPYVRTHADSLRGGLARHAVHDRVLTATTLEDAVTEQRAHWTSVGAENTLDRCSCLDGHDAPHPTPVSVREPAGEITGTLGMDPEGVGAVEATVRAACAEVIAPGLAVEDILAVHVGGDSTPLIRPHAVDWIRQEAVNAIKAHTPHDIHLADADPHQIYALTLHIAHLCWTPNPATAAQMSAVCVNPDCLTELRPEQILSLALQGHCPRCAARQGFPVMPPF